MYTKSSPAPHLYIGVTNNIVRRVAEHGEGTPGSFSKRYQTYRLVLLERHLSPLRAIAREKPLKYRRRAKEIWLIEMRVGSSPAGDVVALDALVLGERPRLDLEELPPSAVREFAVPYARDTRFKYHSLTKPMTSVAAHTLAAAGLLDLDAAVCQYLDPCPDPWAPVRVRHLLNHSSGIPELEGDWFNGWQGDLAATYGAMLEQRSDFALTAQPGTTFRYSNGGYTLLSRIVEVAAGSSIDVAMEALVFSPAAMTDAGMEQSPDREVTPWYNGAVLVPRLAAGYNGSPTEVRTAYSRMHTVPGAGGAYGTADDLVRFARAVFAGNLLPAAAVRAMVTPDTAVHERYADGWVVREREGVRSYSHTGGTNGFLSSLEYYPDRDLTIVILSNLGFTNMQGLSTAVAQAALGM